MSPSLAILTTAHKSASYPELVEPLRDEGVDDFLVDASSWPSSDDAPVLRGAGRTSCRAFAWPELSRLADAQPYTIKTIAGRLARKVDSWKDIARRARAIHDAELRLNALERAPTRKV